MSLLVDPDRAPHSFHAGFKVSWAKHHLRLLDKEVRKYLFSDPKPYSVITQDDLEAGEYIITFDLDPPPLTIALIAGDFVACLRGSLDHLAYALTLCPGGTCNPRAIFPVIDRDNSNGRKKLNIAVQGIPDEAVKIIKALQPYHAGDAYSTTKLWRLHGLWNTDKHRRIPLQKTGINMQLSYSSEFPPISAGTDNSGVLRFPLAAKPYIQLKPTMEVTINFGDESEGIIVPYSELLDIHEFVRYDVMPRFKSFF